MVKHIKTLNFNHDNNEVPHLSNAMAVKIQSDPIPNSDPKKAYMSHPKIKNKHINKE